MKTKLTKRIQHLEPSPTFALDSRVKAMQKEGTSVINLSIGEPDFDTPIFIRNAAIQAIKEGFTHYTQIAGIPELRKAIAEKFERESHLLYAPSQIVVGSGSKAVLYCAFQVLCEKGDDVIVPVPTWSSYVEQIKLTEAKPVFIHLKSPFKLTAKQVREKITSKTKVLLLNTPSNPTGAVVDREELEKIAHLAVKHNFWIVTDEMYEKIIFEKAKHVSIASLGKEIYQRTITINGFSKTYAMTGWRLGYAGGPQEVLSAMADLHGQLAANASSISQKAGLAALACPKEQIQVMIDEFKKRRTFLLERLQKIQGLEIIQPEGSFFFFIGIQKLLGEKYPSAVKWCEALLQEKQVAVIPGEVFFAPGYFRLSFAAPVPKLEKAILKIKEFIHES